MTDTDRAQLLTDMRRMARALVRNEPGVDPEVVARMRSEPESWDVLIGDDDVLHVFWWDAREPNDGMIATIPKDTLAAAVGLLRARREARRSALN